MLNEPAAEEGPQRRHDRGSAGPGANGLTAAVFVEGGTDNREAAGNEERRADSLNAAREDQMMDGRGNTATGGGEGEDHNTEEENPAATIQVAEGASDEDQGGQQEPIGFDDPLDIDDRCVKAGLESRQGDIDDGAINERDAGTEDGRGEDPGSGLGSTGSYGVVGPDFGFIGRGSHGGSG